MPTSTRKKEIEMKFGLSKEVYNKIKDIIKKYPYTFKVFGSRARGNYKISSDIDIAIFSDISEEDEYKIRDDFDKLDIQYLIDLVFITKDTKKTLLESILKEGTDFNE